MNYNIFTVKKYINGLDTSPYKLEELEDNPAFMILAIGLSNDKYLYNLCSNSVKINKTFVKFLIYKYQDDIDFLVKVVDYYLNNSKEFIFKIELLKKMCEITKDKDIEMYLKYYNILNNKDIEEILPDIYNEKNVQYN